LLPPKPGQIERFLVSAQKSSLSYHRHTNISTESPEGFTVDHNRQFLGDGHAHFEKAKAGVLAWKMFDMPWVGLCHPDTPIETGKDVAILIRHFGFYSLNAARIVYVIDEPNRFGFAYGTLEDHGESGEERFSVEYDPETGEVWYDLFAFSRPNLFLAKLGYPLTRMLQKRFARDSKAAMVRAIKGDFR
ncbi:MAG: DUF1990 domain-containing protein, partial [Acidobacteria bacterium]|nr:DUF1990 domain-containing protein [Acidobacteriota bacterium]